MRFVTFFLLVGFWMVSWPGDGEAQYYIRKNPAAKKEEAVPKENVPPSVKVPKKTLKEEAPVVQKSQPDLRSLSVAPKGLSSRDDRCGAQDMAMYRQILAYYDDYVERLNKGERYKGGDQAPYGSFGAMKDFVENPDHSGLIVGLYARCAALLPSQK